MFTEVIMLDIATVSACGDRTHNEDFLQYEKSDNDTYIFALADGLGGHGKGEVASSTCVNTCVTVFERDPVINATEFFEKAFNEAQNTLIEKQKIDNAQNKMKTTLVLCRIIKNTVSWAHIGDSRLYVFRNHKLFSQTLDHSVPQMLVASGEIKPSQIRHHEDRNKLLRALGVNTETLRYQIDDCEFELQHGDAILMCSDGFWEWITEHKMEKFLKKAESAQTVLDKMVKYIIKKGHKSNMDNYSAILILNQ